MKKSIPAILCFSSLLVLNFTSIVDAAEEKSIPLVELIDLKSDEIEADQDVEGKVTLPYADMKRLWEKLRKTAQKPEKEQIPINSVVLAAEYELNILGDKSELTAAYKIHVFSEEWQIIPLIGGEVSLEGFEVEQGNVVRNQSTYSLMAKGAGQYQVKLKLRAAGSRSWSNLRSLKLQPAVATLSRLKVNGLSDDQAIRLEGDGSETIIEEGKDFLLSGDGNELSLHLDSAARLKEAAAMADAPVVESIWEIQSQMFVRYAEGRLKYDARVFAQSDEGSGLSIELLLPRNVTSVHVDGDDLASWRLGRSQDGQRTVFIHWKKRDQLDRQLQLSYELAQSPLSDEWVIIPPVVKGEMPTAKHLIAIETVEGLEWKGEGVSASVTSRRLPKWLSERLDKVEFVTAETQGVLKVQANWLPVLETLQATVSLAKFETRLVNDGAMLVEAEYHVQQDEVLDWTVNIPSLDQILKCEVNGKAVKPVRRNENELEFHLTGSSSGRNENRGTVVSFSYALQSTAFDPVSGQVTVELPQTDLFIHHLDWDLEIPEVYETTAVEGNVHIAAKTMPSKKQEPIKTHMVHLQKELCRGERPAVELYYRRRGIDD